MCGTEASLCEAGFRGRKPLNIKKKTKSSAGRETDRVQYEDMRRQFAEFCTRGNANGCEQRYSKGIKDYDVVCALPGVQMLGLRWQTPIALVIGTDLVRCHDNRGVLREVGEFVIVIQKEPPTFRLHNITQRIYTNHGLVHHPHINGDGVLCIQAGKMEVLTAIVDGDMPVALPILLDALWMRAELGTPYINLSCWPEARI